MEYYTCYYWGEDHICLGSYIYGQELEPCAWCHNGFSAPGDFVEFSSLFCGFHFIIKTQEQRKLFNSDAVTGAVPAPLPCTFKNPPPCAALGRSRVSTAVQNEAVLSVHSLSGGRGLGITQKREAPVLSLVHQQGAAD